MRGNLLALALIGLAGSTLVRADGLLIPTERRLAPVASGLSARRSRDRRAGGHDQGRAVVPQHAPTATWKPSTSFRCPRAPPFATSRCGSAASGTRARPSTPKAARQTYEDIVRRLQDPGLLEYIGRDLWKVRIYPSRAGASKRSRSRSRRSCPSKADMISYQYLLRTGQTVRTTEKDFTMVVRIQSPDPLGPIYSPSHDVERRPPGRSRSHRELRAESRASSTRTSSSTSFPRPSGSAFRS